MNRQLPNQPRVFCIGWHKTGTTTLGLALIKLGYSVLGCRLDMVHSLRDGATEAVLDLAELFDALQDVPWAALYQELDQRFPGSRFILTRRDEQNWLQSASRHFGEQEIPLHDWLYGNGVMEGNEALYLARYRAHNEAVEAYFKDRPDDLLIMDLEQGDGWDVLCDFLGSEQPSSPFPHENKAVSRRTFGERLYYGARGLLPSGLIDLLFSIKVNLRALRGLPNPRNRFHNYPENELERASWSKGKDN